MMTQIKTYGEKVNKNYIVKKFRGTGYVKHIANGGLEIVESVKLDVPLYVENKSHSILR